MKTHEEVEVFSPRGNNFRGRVVARRKDGTVWVLRHGRVVDKKFCAAHLCRRTCFLDKLPSNIPFIWLNRFDQGRTFPDEIAAIEYVRKDEAVVAHV